MSNERTDRILDVVRALRAGEVTTYGDVATVAGYPRQARLVGRVLATTEIEVPWWRVVAASGHLRAHDVADQTAALIAEGVTVTDGRVRDAPIGRFSRRPARAETRQL